MTTDQVARAARVPRATAYEWTMDPERYEFPTPVGYDSRGTLYAADEVRDWIESCLVNVDTDPDEIPWD